jgi:hypothetical protein
MMLGRESAGYSCNFTLVIAAIWLLMKHFLFYYGGRADYTPNARDCHAPPI